MGMGIGKLGSPGTIIKRKFRWTATCSGPWGNIPESFCKVGQRPICEIEATEINYLNAKFVVPGKGQWQPITITYYDVSTGLSGVYSWLFTTYDGSNSDYKQSEMAGWDGTVIIKMYDGCGAVIDTWTLTKAYPESVNFGDLDMADSDFATVELTIRYNVAQHSGGCGDSGGGSCKGC